MYWAIIQEAISQGRRTLDFGRSSPNDGTYHFKEQWGAAPEQLWWEYKLSPGVALPTADRQEAGYQRKIEAWKRLPLSFAGVIGPRIARSVP
jgi:hypothetical protein